MRNSIRNACRNGKRQLVAELARRREFGSFFGALPGNWSGRLLRAVAYDDLKRKFSKKRGPILEKEAVEGERSWMP